MKSVVTKSVVTLVLAGLLVFGGVCGGFAGDTVKVNINTASADELVQLKGVGPSHAAGIVEFREKNGPFQSAGDLIRVTGIGPRTLEKNIDLISVEDSGKIPAQK